MSTLEKKLKMLNKTYTPEQISFGDLHLKVKTARNSLQQIQQELAQDPYNSVTQVEEKAQLKKLITLSKHEEFLLLKQKSRNLWLKEGDNNGKIFFTSMMRRSA